MADEINKINQASSASSSTSVNKWQELAARTQQDVANKQEADRRRQDAIENLDSPNFTKDPAVDQQNQWRKEDREQAQADYEQNRKDALEDYERQKQDSREDYDYKFDKENDITALRKRYEDAGFSAAAAIGAGVSSPVSGAPDVEPSPLDSVPSTSQVSETTRDPSTFEKVMNGLSTLSSLVSTATGVAGLAVDAGVKAATKTSINLANTLAQETIKNEIIASYIMNLKGYAEINAIYHTIDRDNTALDIDAMRLNLDYLAQDLNERRFLFEQESTSRSLDQSDRKLDIDEYNSISRRIAAMASAESSRSSASLSDAKAKTERLIREDLQSNLIYREKLTEAQVSKVNQETELLRKANSWDEFERGVNTITGILNTVSRFVPRR